MSKRLGNAVDPFKTIEKYGPDATRWYMISNAAPWENLKFNKELLDEVRRKFFGTLYNTYAFFALYANIDKFKYQEAEIDSTQRPEIDQWILSLLNTLVEKVDRYYQEFEPTKAARAIQTFVDEQLSNWYVRLCRRRFWKGDYTEDKISAYQTLYTCLVTISKIMSPISPFFADQLYQDLERVTGKENLSSVHLSDFPVVNEKLINKDLEEKMALAQQISSLTLSLRKKVGINVRQPLNKILIPVLDEKFERQVQHVSDLILSETNIKLIEYIKDTSGIISKKIKPNFRSLGAKVGKDMKLVSGEINAMGAAEIEKLETNGSYALKNSDHSITLEDVEITAEDVAGWQVATLGRLTVALDVQITPELKAEGLSRELINRLQNLRKESGLEVTDRINVRLTADKELQDAIEDNLSYICNEILADSLEFGILENTGSIEIDGKEIMVELKKV